MPYFWSYSFFLLAQKQIPPAAVGRKDSNNHSAQSLWGCLESPSAEQWIAQSIYRSGGNSKREKEVKGDALKSQMECDVKVLHEVVMYHKGRDVI